MSSVTPPNNGSVQTVPPLNADLVNAVRDGKCILFLGAGVHYPPDDNDPNYGGSYPKPIRPPVGSDLAKALYDDSDLKNDPEYGWKAKVAIARNLQRMSLYYEIKKDRTKLISKVKQEVFHNKQPSRALKALAELDFPIVCTTNYDNLFEKALILAGKNPNVSSYSNQPSAVTKDYRDSVTPRVDNPFLFKIHGDIDDPTESIVITDEDYIQFILRMITGVGMYYPIPEVFRFHMQIWPMLFIGFSLMDYNLRLLFKLLGWHVPHPKSSYSVGPYPDGLIRKKYDPPVKFIVQDVWDFVPKLYLAVTGKPMP
jgi:hypothetical protein